MILYHRPNRSDRLSLLFVLPYYSHPLVKISLPFFIFASHLRWVGRSRNASFPRVAVLLHASVAVSRRLIGLWLNSSESSS